MSICKKLDKDKIVFMTREDLLKSSDIKLVTPFPREEPYGPVLPNGQVNWGCPCLGNATSGPCGYLFRMAFSCFHDSKEEHKGSDCVTKFEALHECMNKYPNLYAGSRSSKEEEASENSESNKPTPESTPVVAEKSDK